MKLCVVTVIRFTVASLTDAHYAYGRSSMRNSVQNLPSFNDDNTLLPAIAQDAQTGDVLMLAYMNRAAWEETLASKEVVYYSRSRKRLWKKGESSGHIQKLKEAYVDCDGDTILLKVEQLGGAACHEGYKSCFFRMKTESDWKIVGEKVFDPKEIYGKE